MGAFLENPDSAKTQIGLVLEKPDPTNSQVASKELVSLNELTSWKLVPDHYAKDSVKDTDEKTRII